MISILKMNLKLLLRNKGFLFFLLITPIVSSIILGIRAEQDIFANEKEESTIIELTDCTQKALYNGDTTACIVKVYDGCGTEVSEYMLERIARMGMYSVCRADVSDMSQQEVEEQAKKDAFDDGMAAILYIKPELEESFADGNQEQSMIIYDVSSDERKELFKADWNELMFEVRSAMEKAGNDTGEALKLLEEAESLMPQKKTIHIAGKDEMNLTDEQIDCKTIIGYAFAIITLGFMFCGVFVAHTVIEEQNDKVYIRMMLSKVSSTQYYLAKVILAVLVAFLQSVVLAVCMLVRTDLDMGIPKIQFVAVIFMLGLIFTMMSLLLGVILGDVMNSNYAVFAVWSLSALLSGLYFPLDNASAALRVVSYMMPQRWFMKVAEYLLCADGYGWTMLVGVTAAYLIVVISMGSIGLKVKRVEV